jgi:hypothetical protein
MIGLRIFLDPGPTSYLGLIVTAAAKSASLPVTAKPILPHIPGFDG